MFSRTIFLKNCPTEHNRGDENCPTERNRCEKNDLLAVILLKNSDFCEKLS